LAAEGIQIEFHRDGTAKNARLITLSRTRQEPEASDASEPPAAPGTAGRAADASDASDARPPYDSDADVRTPFDH